MDNPSVHGWGHFIHEWQIRPMECTSNTKIYLQTRPKVYISECPDPFSLQVGNHTIVNHVPSFLSLLDYGFATTPDNIDLKARIKRPIR